MIALVALTTASRAQTLSPDLKYMSMFTDMIIFQIQKLLETCKLGTLTHIVVLYNFPDKKLCVVSTLNDYLRRPKDNRNSFTLFVSYEKFNPV